MCGIGGIFRQELFTSREDKEKVYKITSKLLVEMQDRGHDATGISVINTYSNKIRVYKVPLQATKFIKKQRFRKELMLNSYNLVLLHTRAPTVGDPKYNYNNHPIYDQKNNNVLVHNGCINNYKELREQYKLKSESEVDSEVILSMFNHKDKNVKKALKEIRGRIAMALYNKNKLYLYSNSNPLTITYFKNKAMWVFSSLGAYIETAITKKEKLYEVFESEEVLDGFEVYSNYQFKDKDFMEITFEPKKVHLLFEKNVDSLEYWASTSNTSHRRDNLGRNNNVSIRTITNSNRDTHIHCDICNRCLVREYACPDRHTKNGLKCKDLITKDDILIVKNDYTLVKNKGCKRTAIFEPTKIKDALIDVTDEELAFQGD